MKVYRVSSKIKTNEIKMLAIKRKRSGLGGLEQMKLSIVGICILVATLVGTCIGATGMFIV